MPNFAVFFSDHGPQTERSTFWVCSCRSTVSWTRGYDDTLKIFGCDCRVQKLFSIFFGSVWFFLSIKGPPSTFSFSLTKTRFTGLKDPVFLWSVSSLWFSGKVQLFSREKLSITFPTFWGFGQEKRVFRAQKEPFRYLKVGLWNLWEFRERRPIHIIQTLSFLSLRRGADFLALFF